MTASEFLTIDLPAALLACCAAVACALLGNFLVLRRQALLGDAISHVVLPGMVVGILVAGTMSAPALTLGAMGAAVLATLLVAAIRKIGQLEAGAAMGIVFTVMFAAGIVLLEQTGTSNLHLDAEHALFGNLEAALWLAATEWADLVNPSALRELPRQLVFIAAVTAFIVVLIILFFKELGISTFDPGLAATLGLPVGAISVALVVVTAIAAVAAFEAVGSILVIAMFVCPPATARMLTDRLSRQVWLSAVFAAAAAVAGYALAAFGPQLWNSPHSLSAAGMIAVVAGLLQVVAMIGAPRYGVLSRIVRERGRTGSYGGGDRRRR